MNYGSVCSGIEAASVAWEPLGWKPAWFAEVEPFPSAVLAHHWPDVANLGDMTRLARRVMLGEIKAPDVLVGGTPCQAFSVAGMREGLADDRGLLTMKYVELADAIDAVRVRSGNPESIVVWENVPGVLSDRSNAFGCFLGALAGEDRELQPSGKKWTNAGCVYGPSRAIAWRVLDAQYFGVAQRRRRVFVVASARADFDPASVLFEREGVRRDTAPRREAGQGFAADAGGRIDCTGESITGTVSSKWAKGTGGPAGDEHYNLAVVPLLEPGARTGNSTTDPRAGIGIGKDGDPMFTLQAGKQHGVACAVTGDIAHTLNTANNGKGCSEDGTGRGVPTIAFKPGQSEAAGGIFCTTDYSPTLQAANNGSTAVPAVTVALRGREGGATAELGGEVATALRASTGGGDEPHVLAVHGTQDPCVSDSVAFALGRNNGGENAVWTPSICPTLRSDGNQTGGDRPPGTDVDTADSNIVMANLAVRRLTPVECERLQGFPDNHTNVIYRKKPAADGPRYKAIGNSMAVPVMQWIGRRIDMATGGEA